MPAGHISGATIMGLEKLAFPETSQCAVFRVLAIDMK